MIIDDIKNIAVIGAGNMGHQIAMLCAIHGYKTVCTDINAKILKKAESFADTYLSGRVEKERLTEEQAKARGQVDDAVTALHRFIRHHVTFFAEHKSEMKVLSHDAQGTATARWKSQ